MNTFRTTVEPSTQGQHIILVHALHDGTWRPVFSSLERDARHAKRVGDDWCRYHEDTDLFPASRYKSRV